jgi:cytochrome c oxidase subunit II
MPEPVRRKLAVSWWTVLALALVLAEPALADNGGVAPPDPVSENAENVRELYWLVLAITGVIFLVVEVALVLFVVRYRGRGRPREAEGPQVVGHQRLELLWTAVPVLIVAVLAAAVFYKLPDIENRAEASAPGDYLRIRVEGRQFYWRYVYPGGKVSVNELRLPLRRKVELEITAPAYDVIHSWWVPRLAGKMDAIPGKKNYIRFSPDEAGLFKGQCAEFCGAQHALMLASARVVPAAEFDAWLQRPQASLGRQTFEAACAPCHGASGQGLIGPSLRSSTVVGDPEALRNLLENGQGEMPPVGKGWDDRQLRALIAYVNRTFGARQGAAGGG